MVPEEFPRPLTVRLVGAVVARQQALILQSTVVERLAGITALFSRPVVPVRRVRAQFALFILHPERLGLSPQQTQVICK
jgi:hypothetical protein